QRFEKKCFWLIDFDGLVEKRRLLEVLLYTKNIRKIAGKVLAKAFFDAADGLALNVLSDISQRDKARSLHRQNSIRPIKKPVYGYAIQAFNKNTGVFRAANAITIIAEQPCTFLCMGKAMGIGCVFHCRK